MYKKQEYERIGTLSLEEVFSYIGADTNINNTKTKKNKVKIRDFDVNIGSLRLKTFFYTGPVCYCCKIEGEFFAVERNNPIGGYHLNLYGKDKENNDVLFTHDHIVARSLGGQDDLTNTKTMCGPCNWEKGQLELKLNIAINNNDIEEQKLINEQLNIYHQYIIEDKSLYSNQNSKKGYK